jgi:hypothetical protein
VSSSKGDEASSSKGDEASDEVSAALHAVFTATALEDCSV